MKLQWNQPKKFRNPWMQNKEKNREKKRERKETKLGTPKGSKTTKSRACSSASPLVSLYRLLLDFGLYLSVAKIFYFYLIN